MTAIETAAKIFHQESYTRESFPKSKTCIAILRKTYLFNNFNIITHIPQQWLY